MFSVNPFSSILQWLGTTSAQPTASMGPTAKGIGGPPDSITPRPENGILYLTRYSLQNLVNWTRYGVKRVSNKLFPTPFSIHKEKFISLMNQDGKTAEEKMACFNSVVALLIEIPGNHEKDFIEIIAVFAAKAPEKFTDLITKLREANVQFQDKMVNKAPDKGEIAVVQEWVQESGMAGFVAIKQALLNYYLDVATLRVDRTQITWPEKRAYAFYDIVGSPKFRTMVKDIGSQTIRNDILGACLQILDAPAGHSQLSDFAKIMIELDARQQKNQRFGLYSLTVQIDPTGREILVNKPQIEILKDWIKSDSFNLDLLKAGAEKHYFSMAYHVFDRGDLSVSRKLDCLKFIIKQRHSHPTSIKKIIQEFAKNNAQLFTLIAEEVSRLNQIGTPFIVPATLTVNEWFLKDEEFGDRIVNGVKTKVDHYTPKIEILLRAIYGIKIRKQTDNTIAKIKKENLTRAELEEIVKELHEYALIMVIGTFPENMKTTYEVEIKKVFAAVQNIPFFSDLAKAVIDKQYAAASIHHSKAQELEQKIGAHPNSPENLADQEDNLKYEITKKIFDDALTSYIKKGRYTKMQETVRNTVLSDYMLSDEVDWLFIKDGIELWKNADYLDLADPSSTKKMNDVVPVVTTNWKDTVANKASGYWDSFNETVNETGWL